MKKINKILPAIIMSIIMFSKEVQADVIAPGEAIIRDVKNMDIRIICTCVIAAVIIAITVIVIVKLINKSKNK